MPDGPSPFDAEPETWVDDRVEEVAVTVHDIHSWGGLNNLCKILQTDSFASKSK